MNRLKGNDGVAHVIARTMLRHGFRQTKTNLRSLLHCLWRASFRPVHVQTPHTTIFEKLRD